MKYFLLYILLLPLFAIAQSTAEGHYTIYDTRKKAVIKIDELISSADKGDVLFFGEEHNDSIGHMLEYIILTKLYQKHAGKVALSLEMFENDTQLVLDEYISGLIREKNMVKEARAWNNYKDYRPLVEFAKANKIPVIAANAPARYTNMVTRNGLTALQQLNPTAKKYLPPLPIDTASGLYYDKFAETMGGHAAMSAMGGMKIYQSQNLWDATMAHHISVFLKQNTGMKVFQVNGRFHSDQQLGAFAQLKKYSPETRILNIACFSDASFNNPNWSKFENLGDFIIITDPSIPRSF